MYLSAQEKNRRYEAVRRANCHSVILFTQVQRPGEADG
jgi:hypothetical protein